MEGGLIASIIVFALGITLVIEDHVGGVHTAGIVMMALAAVGVAVAIGGHFMPHHHHRA
jgi:hypothetical protein